MPLFKPVFEVQHIWPDGTSLATCLSAFTDSFVTQTIDHRHGVVRPVVTDFNHDGGMDFAAAFAQEHETVEVFLNNGNGEFTRNKIFEAGYPSYGSSGISLSDLDQDGDLDIAENGSKPY